MFDVNTVIYDMPSSIKAYTVRLSNGDYTIVINDKLSNQERMKSYNHEIYHINNGDYERHNADLVEIYSHKKNISEVTL